MQIAAGAVGITCRTIGEAEALLDAAPAFADLLLTRLVPAASELARPTALAGRVRLSAMTGNHAVVEGFSSYFAGEPQHLCVLAECRTGGRRCGAQSPGDAAVLARHIAEAETAQARNARELGRQRQEAVDSAHAEDLRTFVRHVETDFDRPSAGDLTVRMDAAVAPGFAPIRQTFNASVVQLEETIGAVVDLVASTRTALSDDHR